MEKFVFSLGIILFGLALGYVLQILIHQKIIALPYDLETLRKTLQKIALLFFNPIAFLGAIWIINIDDLKIFAMPFIGISALVLGGFLALWFAKMLKMTRKQTGAYIVAGGFTNIGSIGGLLCFIFLGEAGYALMPFYKLFELFSYYGVGFPIAKSYSLDVAETERFSERMKKVLLDPFMLVALGSIFAGVVLNISGLERPNFYGTINAVFVPTATILLLTSIGMAMHFGRIGKYVKEGLLIALIKFIIVPTVATTLAYLVGFGRIDQGLPLKVVMILSSMPVGFNAMVPPTIYDLDVDLANANWLVTTLSLIIVIPVLQYLITLF